MLHRKYITEPACMCAVESMNNMWCRERGGRISEILMNIIIRGDGRHIKDSLQRVGITLLDLTLKHISIEKKQQICYLQVAKKKKTLSKTCMTCLLCKVQSTCVFVISICFRIILSLKINGKNEKIKNKVSSCFSIWHTGKRNIYSYSRRWSVWCFLTVQILSW